MTSVVVVDSGVLLATVLEDEPYSDQANTLFAYWTQHDFRLIAPRLFQYEIVAVSRKAVHKGRLTLEDAEAALDYMLTYPLEYHIDDDLLKRGFELATHFNRPTAYDSQYLALAERFACEFWTADQRLVSVVSQEMANVKFIGNFEQPAE